MSKLLSEVVLDLQPGFASKPSDDEAAIPQLRPLNILDNGSLTLVGTKSVPCSSKQLSRYSLASDDLLFNNTNSPPLVGKATLFDLSGIYVFSNHMTRIRVDRQQILPKYLLAILRRTWEEGIFQRLCTQWVNQAAINVEALAGLPIPVPPLDEQERIVKLLDEADALRKLRAEADRRMGELVPALFYEMFGDPVENPMGWPTSRLSEIVTDLVGGKNVNPTDEPESAYRVLKVSAVTSGTFRPEESKSVPETYVPPSHHFVQPGDLLFSRANTTELVGATSYVFESPPGLLLPDKLWRFVWSGSSVVEPLFIWQLLQIKSMRRQLSRLSNGSGGAMKNISKAKLHLLQIPLPPLALQRHFGELVLSCREIQLQQRHVHLHQTSLLASLSQTELS